MSVATYTGSLNVLGHELLSEWSPRLTVRPEVEAFGPSGIISSKYRTIPVDAETGDFSVTLFPSTELTGSDNRTGVKYILELQMFGESVDGTAIILHQDVWIFTAIFGGGNIRDMGSAPPVALISGPPWPATPQPGTYFDVVTGDVGYYGIEVI